MIASLAQSLLFTAVAPACHWALMQGNGIIARYVVAPLVRWARLTVLLVAHRWHDQIASIQFTNYELDCVLTPANIGNTHTDARNFIQTRLFDSWRINFAAATSWVRLLYNRYVLRQRRLGPVIGHIETYIGHIEV